MTSIYPPITQGPPSPQTGNWRPYYSYGNKESWEAAGSPKSNRPQQSAPDMSAYKPPAQDNPYAFRQPYSGTQDSGYAYDHQSGQWQTPQQSDKTVQDKADDIRQMYGSPATPPGEWRPIYRAPWSPLQFYPAGSDKPDLSYGERPSNLPRPGQAQPIQPQSTGTPYGTQAPVAGTPAPVQSFTLPGYSESGKYGGDMTFGGMSNDGNLAYAPMDKRPHPFTARYTNFDGAVSDQPNYAQRDAFIQSANDAMLPYYSGKAQGAPQFDVQSMWSNAGKMADDGFRNPFSPGGGVQALESYLAKYAPAAMYR